MDEQVLGVAFLFGLVAGKEEHHAAWRAFGDGVGFVARDPTNAEAFGQDGTVFAVPIDQGINGFFVLFEEVDIERVFTDMQLGRDLGDGHTALFGEEKNVIQIGAFADGLAFLLEASAGKAFLRVEIENFIGDDDLRGSNSVKAADDSSALTARAIGFLEPLEMSDGEAGELLEVFLNCLDVFFQAANVFVGFEAVELGDALDLDFG